MGKEICRGIYIDGFLYGAMDKSSSDVKGIDFPFVLDDVHRQNSKSKNLNQKPSKSNLRN
jgi:hypothetical protein